VASTENIISGADLTFNDLQTSNTIAAIRRIEATSPISAEKIAEIIPKRIKSFTPFMRFILNTNCTNMRKTPNSLTTATEIIIPIKKRITSRDANLMKLSISTLLVKNKIPLPRKTRLTLKSQKHNVPSIEKRNTKIVSDWADVKPLENPKKARVPEMAVKSRILM